MAEQVQASHILLMYAGSMRSTATRPKEEALAQIRELKAKIDGGDDFGDLARAHSDCPSAQHGGDLGLCGRGQMGPEVDAAAFAMEVNAISDVVETEFGYHLLKRTA